MTGNQSKTGGHYTRRNFVLAGTAAGTAALAGCFGDDDGTQGGSGGGDDAEGDTEVDDDVINVWHAMGGASGDLLDEMVERYDGAETQSEYQGSYEDILNSLFASIEAGQSPDVVMIDSLHNQQVLDAGASQSAEALLPGDYPIDNLVPAVQDFFRVDGELHSMPFNNSNAILYYNKSAYEEAGLDPESPPETIQEVREHCEALVDSGATNYGISWPNHVWFIETFYSLANELILDNENGHDGAPTTMYAETAFAEDLWTWWRDLYQDDLYLNPGIEAWDESRNAFLTEQVGIMLDSTAAVESTASGAEGDVDADDIDEDDVDGFELGTGFYPSPTDDWTGVVIGGASLWVSSEVSSEHEEHVGQLLADLGSVESQIEWHQGSGYYPIREEAIDQLEEEGWFDEQPHYATAFDQLLATETTPATRRMLVGPAREVQLTIQETSQDIFSGSVSVDEGLANMKESVEEELERYARVADN
ncbi:extracellular solute-binding protein [Natrarchaeobaculum sulfurireducens]|uniref:extracellular solute-binding protein n=1 Tax=Natrarchaeobaculum sulfurireducens TaxID=2044521 RepID=UPI001E299283|nr:extracellular solute-binding protein [Natrarchaeobaculum sulfurireducens]